MSARMRAGVRMMVGVRQPEPNTFGLIVDLTVDLIVDCSRNTVIVYCTYSGMMATPLMASSKSGVSGEKSFRQLMAKAYTFSRTAASLKNVRGCPLNTTAARGTPAASTSDASDAANAAALTIMQGCPLPELPRYHAGNL